MTEIRLDVNIPTVTGNKVTDQLMTWVPTRRRIDSEGVKLPRPFNVNPAYTQVISVDPTGDGWAYAVTEPGDPTIRYFTVPDTEEELLYSQLTRVDPSQIDQGDTLWWAELDRQVVDGSVSDDGVLYFRRRNGEVVPAGYVKGEPGPRGLRGSQGPPPTDESVLNATAQYLETDETVAAEVAQRVTEIAAEPVVTGVVSEFLSYANVIAFGADPSGTSDSTNAFNDAIESLSAYGGGIVYAPRGNYRIEGTINVNVNYVELRGVSRSHTILNGRGISPLVVMLGNENDPGTASNWRWGLGISNLRVTGSTGHGILMQNSLRWKIRDAESSDNAGDGLRADRSNWVGKLHDSFFSGNDGSGVNFVAGWAVDATGNHFIGNGEYGISGLDIATFTGNTLENNYLADLRLNKRAVNVSGNYFEGGRGNMEGPTVLITGERIEFSANSTGVARDTIRLEGAQNISIRNNLRGRLAAHVNNNYRSIYVNETCRNITIDRENGIATIHPDAVNQVSWTAEESIELLPHGEFRVLVDGEPEDGSTFGLGETTYEIVDSFAGENEHGKALLVTNATKAHAYIRLPVSGLTPGKVYTMGAMISHEPMNDAWQTPYDTRFYNTSQFPVIAGDSSIYATNYDRGPFLITRAFEADSETYEVQFGTSDVGSFRIEYVSLVEGLFTEANFPRKKYRKKPFGPTGQRPARPTIGQTYYDTTVGAHVVWNGTEWVDSAGNVA